MNSSARSVDPGLVGDGSADVAVDHEQLVEEALV
jgi:hypothetical protein